MANVKRGVKARRLLAEKENIANIAKWILIAFCLQFVFYIGIINVVPMLDLETEELNGLYSEIWINYKGSEGNTHVEGNGIKFIYAYNMVLLVAATGLVIYYALVFMEENEGVALVKAKEFLKQNKGLLFLILFMIWGFISSCLAYDKFRSFIGCYNLRDGYFSFMFYGSILVCMLLMGITGFNGKVKKIFNKFDIDPRRLIVDIFIAVMVLIAAITLGDYYELNDPTNMYKGMVIKFADGSKSGDSLGISIEPKYAQIVEAESGQKAKVTVARATTGTVTSSVFNNSNHYAYVLSIAVVVAAVMFIKSNNYAEKVWYLISFAVLTWMLIINDTFGAYLGIMISFVLLLIHTIVTKKDLVYVLITLAVFTTASMTITNTKNEKIVVKNFSYITQSISDILDANSENSDDKNTKKEIIGLSGDEVLVQNISAESNENEKDLSDVAAGDAGSGRWKLWIGAWEIIKKKPVFGAGLENMIYEYDKIGIGEGRSHNLILQLAGTIGIPGMIFYVLGVAFIFFKALKYYKVWDMYTYMGMFVMISYLISSLTGNSGFYTSGYFYIFVGFVVLGTINCGKNMVGEKNKKK